MLEQKDNYKKLVLHECKINPKILHIVICNIIICLTIINNAHYFEEFKKEMKININYSKSVNKIQMITFKKKITLSEKIQNLIGKYKKY